MNIIRSKRRIFFLLCAMQIVASAAPAAAAANDDIASAGLRREILAADQRITDAYDRCRINALKAMFSQDAELYFAGRGSTRHLFEHIDTVRRDICGQYRREASAEAQQIFALPGIGGIDGAIQVGTQSFCVVGVESCRGMRMRFVAIWQRSGSDWKISRLLRYEYEALR